MRSDVLTQVAGLLERVVTEVTLVGPFVRVLAGDLLVHLTVPGRLLH